MSAEHPFDWLTVNKTRRVDRHPLEGRIWWCTWSEIANALEMAPATREQLWILGMEESKNPGGDRSDVYRLLHEAQIKL